MVSHNEFPYVRGVETSKSRAMAGRARLRRLLRLGKADEFETKMDVVMDVVICGETFLEW